MLNYHACVQKSPTIGLPVTKLYTNHMVLVRRSAVARLKGFNGVSLWVGFGSPSAELPKKTTTKQLQWDEALRSDRSIRAQALNIPLILQFFR